MELNARTSLRVVCLGGELKKTTGSCTGTFAEQMLKSMYFNTVFIGLPRISKTGVLSTSSMSELSIKRAAIDHASQVIQRFLRILCGIANQSAFGQSSHRRRRSEDKKGTGLRMKSRSLFDVRICIHGWSMPGRRFAAVNTGC